MSERATTATIFMPLEEEGTAVWRPVEAIAAGEGVYQIIGIMPENEKWLFCTGSVVRCGLRADLGSSDS